MMEQEITSLKDESSKKLVKLIQELRKAKNDMKEETTSLKMGSEELKEEETRMKEKIASLEKFIMIAGWEVCA